ncbi:MAG: trehalase [Flavobacteriales bacterium]|nr:trehalase [Flavobacteriia bacterium]NCP05603.1 trehalase [Flavobacteriales bacterium]PIV95020.1 MAG: trehalase [Flavobacteriaceae bacterium CG17_big_fil_post_rev_8_21_14_2_50_33_15]PIY09436.1 MAG: trehalase [Flavobacteriaceae bacterium CG_4_10_14_3_um_filter_33_47]PJB19968.1 MAG: trehalase [Flavobacteriaceae bacterium CG_4_9_14_3_um_filter_33_16]
MILKVHIETCLSQLLFQEDTDHDKKITIEDRGPKAFDVVSLSGESYIVKGTYHLSNLLQELVIAKNQGFEIASIDSDVIEEKPVDRVSKMIKDYYWDGLTRMMDESGIQSLIHDTKNESLASEKLRIYVPFKDELAFNYYRSLEHKLPITAIKLPEAISPEYVKSINNKPGILALKLQTSNSETVGVPFVVPGGRFNEMYGWDSYFESVGLLIDDKVDLAKGMADNFQYEIEHYGKILNANRSYYLTRTQPPFYTSLIREVFEKTNDKAWLKSHLKTAIKEYETVWMVKGKRLSENGLNRYLAEGIGFPPECEMGHFDAILKPYADEVNLPIREYEKAYAEGQIVNKELDAYFVHDRTVRESGHDTSYRIEGHCADLNLVELNAMLYKYETDFAELITQEFDGIFENYTTQFWNEKAEMRKNLVNRYLWNEEKGLYFDFNVKTNSQSGFVSATTLTPLWAKLCSENQAQQLIEKAVPLLKEKGGIAGSTKRSRGDISEDRPQRQWDYPNGWAPHQMMIWKGLFNYGYINEAQELIYRWLFMITRNAVDYNGTIPEKYDVVEATHKVFAEYGNVGTDFEYITQEGFGWMNASYQYGLTLLHNSYKEKLNNLVSTEKLF